MLEADTPGDISKKKTRYFQDLAADYLPEMRLLMRGGQLSKSEGWRNVVEHSLVEVAAADVLAVALDLPETERQALKKAAAIHDWDKRLEKQRAQPTDQDQAWLEKINADPNLVAATHSEFIYKALVEKTATFLEKLQYYIDNITDESDLVPALQRIAIARTRNADLDLDDQLTERLQGKYWDKETELTQNIETEIFTRFSEALKIEIGAPDKIPIYIKQQIEKKYA